MKFKQIFDLAFIMILFFASASLSANLHADSKTVVNTNMFSQAGLGVGGQLWTTGEKFSVKILPSNAGYNSDIFWVDPTTGKEVRVGNSKSDVGKVWTYDSFRRGREIIFTIKVNNTGKKYYTGPANRNSDNFAHAMTTNKGNSVVLVGFEDLEGGGDKDYDDVTFEVTGLSGVPVNAYGIGGNVWSTGERFTVKIIPSTAAYNSDIYFVDPVNGKDVKVGNSKADVGKSFSFGAFGRGEEILFWINVKDTKERFAMGRANRNKDGIVHARTTDNGSNGITVGFEDLLNGGDRDYDDAQFVVTGLSGEEPSPYGACGGLWSKGEPFSIEILSGKAAYNHDVYIRNPLDGTKVLVGNTKKNVGKVHSFPAIPRGTPLEIYIHVINTGHKFHLGLANLNSDKICHAKTKYNLDTSIRIGFEDLVGGGDRDFDDANIRVKGVSGQWVGPYGLAGSLWSSGASFSVKILPSTAAYNSEIFFICPLTKNQVRVGNSKTDLGKTFDFPAIPIGYEVVFLIYVNNTKQTFISGPADRNPDKIAHVVTTNNQSSIQLGFEDLLGGGDRDFDDVVVKIVGLQGAQPTKASC